MLGDLKKTNYYEDREDKRMECLSKICKAVSRACEVSHSKQNAEILIGCGKNTYHRIINQYHGIISDLRRKSGAVINFKKLGTQYFDSECVIRGSCESIEYALCRILEIDGQLGENSLGNYSEDAKDARRIIQETRKKPSNAENNTSANHTSRGESQERSKRHFETYQDVNEQTTSRIKTDNHWVHKETETATKNKSEVSERMSDDNKISDPSDVSEKVSDDNIISHPSYVQEEKEFEGGERVINSPSNLIDHTLEAEANSQTDSCTIDEIISTLLNIDAEKNKTKEYIATLKEKVNKLENQIVDKQSEVDELKRQLKDSQQSMQNQADQRKLKLIAVQQTIDELKKLENQVDLVEN